jgi:hypothetical protein
MCLFEQDGHGEKRTPYVTYSSLSVGGEEDNGIHIYPVLRTRIADDLALKIVMELKKINGTVHQQQAKHFLCVSLLKYMLHVSMS